MSIAIPGADVTSVFGKRGYGKTTWARNAAEDFDQAGLKVWIFDQRRQFPEWDTFDLASLERQRPETWSRGLVVLDEVDLLCTSGRIHPTVRHLLHYSRHQDLDVIMTARRPANVHRDATALSDHFIIFRVTEPRDLHYILQFTSDVEESEIRNLPKFQFLNLEV